MKCVSSSVEVAVAALAEGRTIIVIDSSERENEGDFLAAAEKITPAAIHFMITQGRGQLCMPVMPQLAQRLDLTPLIPQRSLEAPCFAMPVDYRTCKTGISPLERALTIRAMLDASTTAADFVRPGQIFPLIALPEGILGRAGHTEAAVDLARLAGLAPAGVLCEICSRDGLNMAEGWELRELADEFQLPIISIDELIAFRERYERNMPNALFAPAATAACDLQRLAHS